MMNHDGVLGAEASDEALRTAYRRRARETHPDHGGTRVRFAEVRAAWDVLHRPSQRAAYDRELRARLCSTRTASDSVQRVRGRTRVRALASADRGGERLLEVGDRLVGGLGDLLLDGVDRGL